MELFEIIDNLYKNPKADWILKLNDNEINVVVINVLLIQDLRLSKILEIVDGLKFKLPKKMYLSLLWALMFIKRDNEYYKINKVPEFKFFKKSPSKYTDIIKKIQFLTEISEHDIFYNKAMLTKMIDYKLNWFLEQTAMREKYLGKKKFVESVED